MGKALEILGRWPQALDAYRSAMLRCRENGDRLGAAHALTEQADVQRKQGNFDEARALLEESRAEFEELHDRDGRAAVLHIQGTLASQQGDFDAGRAAYQESLDIRNELDDLPKIGALLSNLAVVAEQTGDLETARRMNERALAVREKVGDPWAIAVSQNNLGMIALLQDDFARADVHLQASIALAERVGDRWIAAVGAHNKGIAQRGLGNAADSGDQFLEALEAYVDYDDRWSLMLLAEDVVFLAVDTGQFAAAVALLARADALHVDLDAPRTPTVQAQLAAAMADVSVESEALPSGSVVDLIRTVCLHARGRSTGSAP